MRVKFKSVGLIASAILIAVSIVNWDVLVRATAPGVSQMVSYTSTGGLANAGVSGLISANGKAMTLFTNATNMVSSGVGGLFHKNLENGVITRIGVSTGGVLPDATVGATDISATGRYIIFQSKATNLIDGATIPSANNQLYLRDVVAGTTTLITQSLSGSVSNGAIVGSLGVSSDGRFISFFSNASNLHSDSTDGTSHLYMLDRSDDTLSILDRKVSDGSVGYTADLWAPNGDMSCDGSMIVFTYGGQLISGPSGGSGYHVDVYLLDRRGAQDKLSNITAFANKAAMGPRISCSGDYVGFKSSATNIDPNISVTFNWSSVWPFVYDRVNGTYHLAAVSNAGSSISDTSACGSWSTPEESQCIYVTDTGLGIFTANNTALTGVSGTQAYMRDIRNNTTSIISINSSGVPANNFVSLGGVRADGTVVLIRSNASNLVSGDTNAQYDLFTAQTGK